MAEDQGVNGDRWTDEAYILLTEFGWNKIADSNIDITGPDKIPHGIDSLYWFADGYDLNRPKGVFLEAKRYKTTSFQGAKLGDWITTLYNKIKELAMSESLFDDYPEMEVAIKFNGLIVIWFHDTDNYDQFRPKLLKSMEEVSVPRTRSNNSMDINLYVLDNHRILELASMVTEIKKLKINDDSFSFYYPSIIGNPSNLSKVLNFEYIYSKFILAKGRRLEGNSTINIDYVFYYGDIKMNDFYLLVDALLKLNSIVANNEFNLFLYKRDIDVFRKIKPDLEKLINSKGVKTVSIKYLENSQDLPTWMLDQ